RTVRSGPPRRATTAGFSSSTTSLARPFGFRMIHVHQAPYSRQGSCSHRSTMGRPAIVGLLLCLAPFPAAAPPRNPFHPAMTRMNGMIPVEPMAGMRMPWHLMAVGIATATYDNQGGPSGGDEGDSVNWNMLHLQGSLGPGLLSVMMMN